MTIKAATQPRPKSTTRPTKTSAPPHAAATPTTAPRRTTCRTKTPSAAPEPAPQGSGKEALLLSLLQRPAGASLAQLTEATGWQPHSVRGVISGVLRKKRGLNVASVPQADGSRLYRILP